MEMPQTLPNFTISSPCLKERMVEGRGGSPIFTSFRDILGEDYGGCRHNARWYGESEKDGPGVARVGGDVVT